MIKGNLIKFGYGDVVLASSELGLGYIQITNIKPPCKCGKYISKKDLERIEIGLTIKIYEDNPWDLYNLIKTVNENNRVVKYKEYIFDFSNYNEESVKVVKNACFHTICIRALAC